MKPLFGKAWMGFAAVAALTLVGCQRPNNVAVINGEPITQEDFSAYLKVKPEVQIVTPQGQVVNATVNQTLGFQALQDLIRQRIILQLAKDMKVEPTTTEVNKEVEFQRKRDPQFVNNLMQRGLTLEQIRESLKVDLARERLLTKDINIPMSEVDQFIKDNPQRFTIPELVDALWVFVRDDKGRRDVERALQAGGTFSTVATRFSQAPGARENGGRFEQRVIDAVPAPEVRNLLRTTREGTETNWVRLQDGWAKFFVEKRTPAEKQNVTEVEKEWLQRQLKVSRGLQANDLDQRLLEKLRDAKIEVNDRAFKQPWEAAMEQLKRNAEAEGTTPTSPTAEGSPERQQRNQGGGQGGN